MLRLLSFRWSFCFPKFRTYWHTKLNWRPWISPKAHKARAIDRLWAYNISFCHSFTGLRSIFCFILYYITTRSVFRMFAFVRIYNVQQDIKALRRNISSSITALLPLSHTCKHCPIFTTVQAIHWLCSSSSRNIPRCLYAPQYCSAPPSPTHRSDWRALSQ